MKTLIHSMLIFVSIFTTIFTSLNTPQTTAQSANLIQNPSMETVSGATPTNWQRVKWGSNTATYTVPTNGQQGSRSTRINVTAYTSGDIRWQHTAVNVVSNTQYSFSAWYKSNVPTLLLAETTLTNNTKSYAYLSTLSASNTNWSQATATYSAGAQAKSVSIYMAINSVGYLQTDNYSLTAPTVVQPPQPTNGFRRPLVSLDFDDAWKTAYFNGLPVVEEFGMKATFGVISDTIDNVAGYGDEYVTSAQIRDISARGHRIANHTRTHRPLPSLSGADLASEIQGAQTTLRQLTGQSVNYFITPYCDYNSVVTNTVSQTHIGMRNCDDTINFKNGYNRFNLRSYIVRNTTTLSEIQTVLDRAKAENAWVIFMYHEVRDTQNYDDLWLSSSQLRQQLQLIRNSNISVLPAEDALLEINPQI
jgi:peptidoglycan/xylan/chitin deacetylase (PgdA/CDA1 family)